MVFYILVIVVKILLDKINILYIYKMPCGTYNYGGCRTTRQRGLLSGPIMGRLSYLNRQQKPAPTRNYGSEDARARLLRRRVGKINMRSLDLYGNVVNSDKYGYGPLFGLRKGIGKTWLSDGQCKYIYTANNGSGSDVTYWKRVYGGSMNIVTTGGGGANSCAYGCRSV
jgi:hypothetical protein